MITTNGMMAALAAGALLAGLAGAEVSAVSSDSPLDTRSLSIVTDVEEQDLDTRSYTTDWSAARRLNTKKIIGTAILIR
ncbi:MAG TPA: hypothetical protein P5026_13020 [Kiritimatiellia bacterium]|nr:hypothetical protein [Kiritimatiellia bacterium]HRU71666.1 hypothetical protein [Kiritimatiellia bacterium]